MTNWWVVVNIPGWMASLITRIPEASVIPSYRRLSRFTDNSIEIVDNVTGSNHSYGLQIITSEEFTLHNTHNTQEYPCVVHHIEVGPMRSTEGIIGSTSTTYWHIHTADGTFQVHKTMNNDTTEPVQWTIEMWGEAPDADTLLRVIRKHISS